LAAAGTFTLTTFAFKEVIIPTQIADINNKIRDLPSLEQGIETLRIRVKEKDAEISGLKKQVESLQQRNLFSSGDPIPNSLSKVQLGQPISDLENFFQAKSIDKEGDSYWNVTLDYGVFREITYYFDETSKQNEITHISYAIPAINSYSSDFLHDRLVDALGPPTSNPRRAFFHWKTKNHEVYKIREESFLILPPGASPGYWPDPQS